MLTCKAPPLPAPKVFLLKLLGFLLSVVLFSYAYAENCKGQLNGNTEDSYFPVQSIEEKQGSEILIANASRAVSQLIQNKIHLFNEVSRTDESASVTSISINGKSYRILAELGSGEEGEVFLLEKDGVKYTAKEFKTLEKLRINLSRLQQLRDYGFNAIREIEVDERYNTVLFPYIRGLPLGAIQINPLMSPESIREVRGIYYSTYLKHLDRLRYQGIWIEEQNVLFDLDSQQMIVIDPH